MTTTPRYSLYSRHYKHYRETVNVSYALIADIVRSRELPDRRRAQHVIYETLDRAAEGLALTQHPYATIGNERSRSEERRVGKECRSRWSPYH